MIPIFINVSCQL